MYYFILRSLRESEKSGLESCAVCANQKIFLWTFAQPAKVRKYISLRLRHLRKSENMFRDDCAACAKQTIFSGMIAQHARGQTDLSDRLRSSRETEIIPADSSGGGCELLLWDWIFIS